MATLVFPFINIFLVKRRNKVRNSVKLIRFRAWALYVSTSMVYMLHVHVWRLRFACRFSTVSGSVRAHIVLVQHVLFSFHTYCGQLTDSACIARNKKHQASRLARSIRSQPVINTGHYQRFKHHHALSTKRNSETVWGIHELGFMLIHILSNYQ